MKKNIYKIMALVIILMILLVSKAEAANFEISSSNVSLDVGKSISIDINALTHTGRINISSSNTNVATVNTQSFWVENNSQTITISAKNAGNTTITISGDLFDTQIGSEKAYQRTIDVKVNEIIVAPPVQTQTPTQSEPEKPTTSPTTTPGPKVIEFTSVNETVYVTGTVNVRETYSASANKLGQLKEGDSVTRTGVSKSIDEDGNRWSKIAYSGTTAYVISGKLTTKKPEEQLTEQPTEQPAEDEPLETQNEDETTEIGEETNNGLKTLEIEGLTLSPSFNPNIYEYRVIVKKDINELPINAIPALEGATVTIAGNDLQEGENLINILVYNENNDPVTYQITTNKNTLNLAETDKMLSEGTLQAKRNVIIFISTLGGGIVALIILMIIKNKTTNNEYEDERIEEQEFTSKGKIVEHAQAETVQEEIIQDKKEKKKGKHF